MHCHHQLHKEHRCFELCPWLVNNLGLSDVEQGGGGGHMNLESSVFRFCIWVVGSRVLKAPGVRLTLDDTPGTPVCWQASHFNQS